LASINADRARAIVKVTDAAMPEGAKQEGVRVVEVSPGLGVIIVGPSQMLRKIQWLRLIEMAPTRFLLTIPLGTSIEAIEVWQLRTCWTMARPGIELVTNLESKTR